MVVLGRVPLGAGPTGLIKSLPAGTISPTGLGARRCRLALIDASHRITLPLHAAVEPLAVQTLLERQSERPQILRLLTAGRQIVVDPRWRHALLVVRPLLRGRASGDQPEDRQHRGHAPPHWITRSARVSSDEGIARPRALAAWRFTKSSKRAGCSTARSTGRAPRRIRSTRTAIRRNASVQVGP